MFFYIVFSVLSLLFFSLRNKFLFAGFIGFSSIRSFLYFFLSIFLFLLVTVYRGSLPESFFISFLDRLGSIVYTTLFIMETDSVSLFDIGPLNYIAAKFSNLFANFFGRIDIPNGLDLFYYIKCFYSPDGTGYNISLYLNEFQSLGYFFFFNFFLIISLISLIFSSSSYVFLINILISIMFFLILRYLLSFSYKVLHFVR